jgi:putative Holliday junction resolvase
MAYSKLSALGLDLGSKRIGVAGCDGLGLIATGITTIKHQSFQQTLEELQNLVQEREVQLLIIGLPYSMNGEVGTQAKRVQKFAHRLATALELPLEFVDERLTSYEAEEQLKARNLSPSRNKGLIDRQAATIILQQWLDQRRSRQTS